MDALQRQHDRILQVIAEIEAGVSQDGLKLMLATLRDLLERHFAEEEASFYVETSHPTLAAQHSVLLEAVRELAQAPTEPELSGLLMALRGHETAEAKLMDTHAPEKRSEPAEDLGGSKEPR